MVESEDCQENMIISFLCELCSIFLDASSSSKRHKQPNPYLCLHIKTTFKHPNSRAEYARLLYVNFKKKKQQYILLKMKHLSHKQ